MKVGAKLWEHVKAQIEARDACPGHSFTRIDGGVGFPKFRCDHCRWEPRAGEKAAYLQGLEHGKKFGFDCTCNPLNNTGGGHSRDCPEYSDGPEYVG